MNKYTNMIDSLFSKYGKPTDKYIFLGACKQGDEDGGMDEWSYMWFDEVYEKMENFNHYENRDVLDPYPYGHDDKDEDLQIWEDFKKDFEAFRKEIDSSFPDFMKEDYDSTNCYWYRCYFATRDHNLFQVVTSSWDPMDRPADHVIDLDKFTDQDVADKADAENLTAIKAHLNDVKHLLKELKTQQGVNKGFAMLRNLLGV